MIKQPNRMISLDMLRGFTVAAMIMVNFPGDEEHVFFTLRHTIWNGLSFTDHVAPIFLFIVGVSISLAYTKAKKENAPKSKLYKKIVLRSLKIFAVGMFLNLMPDFDFSSIRWTGTLHRIAIVFLVSAFIFLNTNWKQQAYICGGILIAYWLVMTTIPLPGYGKVMLEPGVNIAAWIDNKFLPGKMWQGTWDPEGILSTFPSIATCITGMLAGRLIQTDFTPNEKVNYLMTAGLISVIAGYFLGLAFPVNENLWTSSFVLVTSGVAALLLGALIFLVDIKKHITGGKMGIILGANAISVYVFGDLLALIFYRMKVAGQPLNALVVSKLVEWSVPPNLASLLYALFFVGMVFIPAWILYRNKIIIKL